MACECLLGKGNICPVLHHSGTFLVKNAPLNNTTRHFSKLVEVVEI